MSIPSSSDFSKTFKKILKDKEDEANELRIRYDTASKTSENEYVKLMSYILSELYNELKQLYGVLQIMKNNVDFNHERINLIFDRLKIQTDKDMDLLNVTLSLNNRIIETIEELNRYKPALDFILEEMERLDRER